MVASADHPWAGIFCCTMVFWYSASDAGVCVPVACTQQTQVSGVLPAERAAAEAAAEDSVELLVPLEFLFHSLMSFFFLS